MSTASTPWQSGRLGPGSGQRLLFGQMFEDPALELDAFRHRDRIFCIASAGDIALALAPHHDVVACDINAMQLAYAQRRLLGAPRETGDADRLLTLARRARPLIGWGDELLRRFLSLTHGSDQVSYWRHHLDTWRFRTGLTVLLSRFALAFTYRHSLRRALPRDFSQVLHDRLERGFSRHPNASNPFARALLLGEPAPSLPPAPAVTLVHADAAAYLEACSPGSFDGFTLSNILDGADAAYRRRLVQAVRHAASKDALVLTRSFAEPLSTLDNHAPQDRALLWGAIEIAPVHTWA